jgi:hypothetical protein
MDFTVQLDVHVDVDALAAANGLSAAEALRVALAQVRDPNGWALLSIPGHVVTARAQVRLFSPAQQSALAQAINEDTTQ